MVIYKESDEKGSNLGVPLFQRIAMCCQEKSVHQRGFDVPSVLHYKHALDQELVCDLVEKLNHQSSYFGW